jgi:hypothetical protein
MEESGLHVLYDVADASWVPHANTVCNVVLSENHIIKVVFDLKKQRFVRLYAAENQARDTGWIAGHVSDISRDNPEIRKRWFLSVPKTLIVPEVLYDEGKRKELFENHQVLDSGQTLESTRIKRLDAEIIFAVDHLFGKLLQETGSMNGAFQSADGPWLDALFLNHKNRKGMHLHVNISDGFISIAAFKDEGLQFYNTFLTVNSEEVLYYIMFVSEQLHVNPQQDAYFFSGYITKGDQTINMVSKYIREFNPEDRPSQFSYSMPVIGVPGHLFFQSFCTPLCE